MCGRFTVATDPAELAERFEVAVPEDWTPSYNIALTQTNRVYWPGAGGKLFYRDDADSATSATQTVVFYGSAAHDPCSKRRLGRR